MMRLTRYGDYEKRILFPVFSNFQVRFVFTTDFKKSYEERYQRTLDKSLEFVGGFHAGTKSGCSHIFLKIGNAPSGTIAHEVVHAVWQLLLGWAGVEKLDEEIVAYHVGYLVSEAVDCRNWLIDKGVGVQSNSEVKSNVGCDPQRTDVAMYRLQPRPRKMRAARTS